jgi:sialic acid synthase SpsE
LPCINTRRAPWEYPTEGALDGGDGVARNPVLVVAEIGNNHEGSLDTARELVRAAARVGAGAVKFQTFRVGSFQGAQEPARRERLRSLELPPEAFGELRILAHSLGLLFLATPLDLDSANFLTGLVDAFKVASGDNNFYPLLGTLAGTGKPVILSSGLAGLRRMRHAKDFLDAFWRERGHMGWLAVLHCVSCYPVPQEEANLAAITTLSRELRCPVGYSDHTMGIDACLGAVALGATIIEKHFTLDKAHPSGGDHRLSADPAEMADLVRRVENMWHMLGTGVKLPQPCERAVRMRARRSIAVARDLPAGHRLRLEDLVWLRPAGGLSPGHEARVLGRRLTRGLLRGERITSTVLEAGEWDEGGPRADR